MRSTSLRTVRVVTPSSSASCGPDQSRRPCSSDSKRSSRVEVFMHGDRHIPCGTILSAIGRSLIDMTKHTNQTDKAEKHTRIRPSASTSPRPTSTTSAGAWRRRAGRSRRRRRRSPTGAAASPLGVPARARRLLGARVRLARPGGAAERVPAVHHHHRRPDHPLPARAFAQPGRDAAHHHPRLAQLLRGVRDIIGPLTDPRGARRRSGRRVSPGDPVAARVRVLDAAGGRRVGQPVPRRRRVGRADAPARI